MSIAATPATLAGIIAAAVGGETIRLQPGDYGRVKIGKRSWAKRVTIHANKARIAWSLTSVVGLTIYGGVSRGALGKGPDGYAVQVVSCRQVSVFDMDIAESLRAIVVDRCQDVIVRRNDLHHIVIDGINIALSQRVKVQDNVIHDFTPGEDHPDGIQGWSRPGGITTDVLVEGNRIRGAMQGIFFGNHADRGGVDDGGFDRVIIRGNDVEVSYPQGINLSAGRDSEVSGNSLRTVPGAKHKASLNINGGTVRQSANTVGPKR